jgi:hypothetical protein
MKPIRNKSMIRNNEPATISIVCLFDVSVSMSVAGTLYYTKLFYSLRTLLSSSFGFWGLLSSYGSDKNPLEGTKA